MIEAQQTKVASVRFQETEVKGDAAEGVYFLRVHWPGRMENIHSTVAEMRRAVVRNSIYVY